MSHLAETCEFRPSESAIIFKKLEIEEESADGDYETDSILGITVNGIPYATMISYFLDKEE